MYEIDFDYNSSQLISCGKDLYGYVFRRSDWAMTHAFYVWH